MPHRLCLGWGWGGGWGGGVKEGIISDALLKKGQARYYQIYFLN